MMFEWAEHVLGSLASLDSEALRCGHQGKVQVVEVISWFPRRLKVCFHLHRRDRARGLRLKGMPC